MAVSQLHTQGKAPRGPGSQKRRYIPSFHSLKYIFLVKTKCLKLLQIKVSLFLQGHSINNLCLRKIIFYYFYFYCRVIIKAGRRGQPPLWMRKLDSVWWDGRVEGDFWCVIKWRGSMVRADETQHSGSTESRVKEINRRQDVKVP